MNPGTGPSTDADSQPPPFSLTATEAIQRLADGSLLAADLVDSCLERIAAIDPHLNAMVTVAEDRARQEAAEVDAARARGEAVGPLAGVPVAIKDLQATEGVRTTLGAAQFVDHVPSKDAGIVARVRAAGGIVIGKTNIPERSIGANTVNRLFGATGNPFDPARSCGGSSGGSAVALAANMAPLATGSDHGGSLRIPACYCGVVGFRATPGVVPFEERTTPQTYYSVQGPMARTVDDLALLLSVITDRSGPAPRDPMAFPLDAAAFAALDEVDPSELRVGFTEDLGGVLVSDPIRSAFRDRIGRLADTVAVCEEVTADLTAAMDVDWRLRSDVFVTQYRDEVASWDDGFNPNIRATYDAALETPMVDIATARRQQMELIQRFQLLTDRYDVIICPGVSVSPFPWRELFPRTVDGAPVDNYMAWLTLTASITVIGHPVVALPVGLDQFDMPFGLQVIGRSYDDRRLLSIARSLEGLFNASPETARPVPSDEIILRAGVDLSDITGVFAD